MLCAAIDIGSNTARLLVAEPRPGGLRTVLEQRAYTRIGQATDSSGAIAEQKVAELADIVATQVRLAEELGAEAIRPVATAAIRDASNRAEVVRAVEATAGVELEVLSETEEARLAFLGATRANGHLGEGPVAVIDVGGGSSEVAVGTVAGGVEWSRSFRIGSGSLTDRFPHGDPPSEAELERMRAHVTEHLTEVEPPSAVRAVAVGGTATSLRKVVGAELDYETLERAVRVLTEAPIDEVARRFDLDPVRVEILPAGVLLLERLSELLGLPLHVGKGGLREGIVLDLLNGDAQPGAGALAA